MSVKEFNLPDPGEGLTEAEIVTWNVKVGDTVKVNDIVVEIETAKSLVELPVPFAGTVTALLVSEGEMVEVGTPIIAVDTARRCRRRCRTPRRPAPSSPASRARPPRRWRPLRLPPPDEEEIEEGKIGGTTSTGRTAVLVGYGVKQTEAKRRPRKGAPAGRRRPRPSPPPSSGQRAARRRRARGDAAEPAVAREGGARALAKPPVRKYAKDLGIDLGQVAGSGEGGIISRADVDAHAGGRAPHRRRPGHAPAATRRGSRPGGIRWHRCSPAAVSARRASRSRASAR